MGTDEVREHSDYYALYSRLKRAMRKQLVYATEPVNAPAPMPVSQRPRMSEAFVAAIDKAELRAVDRPVR